MPDIQQPNLSELVAALSAGDRRGQIAQAGTQAFQQGMQGAREAKAAAAKEAFRKKLELAGLAQKERGVAAQEASLDLQAIKAGRPETVYDPATGQSKTFPGMDVRFSREAGKLVGPGDPGFGRVKVLGGRGGGKGTGLTEEQLGEIKGRVTTKLGALGQAHQTLKNLGAAVDVDQSAVHNLTSYLRASGLGQFAEKMIGTDAQSVRNTIQSMQPLLLQDLRQATQMGARGMDSEKELEFYLRAATNPQLDKTSNDAIIKVLNATMGSGEPLSTEDAFQLFVGFGGDGAALQRVRAGVGDTPAQAATGPVQPAGGDVSQMSDDELRRIIHGQ